MNGYLRGGESGPPDGKRGASFPFNFLSCSARCLNFQPRLRVRPFATKEKVGSATFPPSPSTSPPPSLSLCLPVPSALRRERATREDLLPANVRKANLESCNTGDPRLYSRAEGSSVLVARTRCRCCSSETAAVGDFLKSKYCFAWSPPSWRGTARHGTAGLARHRYVSIKATAL